MSLCIKNIVSFENPSQKIILIKLKVERTALRPGCSLPSADFPAVGKQTWYFRFVLSKEKQMSVWLKSRVFLGLNICCTAMIYDAKKQSLFGNMSYFSFKDDIHFEILRGFLNTSVHFPLTMLCYLVISNTDMRMVTAPNLKQTVTSIPIQNINEVALVALDKHVDKEISPIQDTPEKVTTETNNCDNVLIDCLQELSVNLKKLLDQAIGTDITMHVEGISMKAHKMILRARSPVFEKMFEHDTIEAAQNEIDIKDIRAPIMKELLMFLYAGTKENHRDFDDACDLYYAADKYEVLSLRNACKKDLLRHLQVDNACQLLSLASNHGDESLKEEIIQFIKTNFKAIVASKSFEDLAKYDANLAVLLMRNHMLSNSE